MAHIVKLIRLFGHKTKQKQKRGQGRLTKEIGV